MHGERRRTRPQGWLPRLLTACACSALAFANPAAIQRHPGLEGVDEALRFIRTSTPAERARFNREYRVLVGRPPVDYLEVVTPFRAVVLAGSARAAAGDRSFGQRLALELLKGMGDTDAVHAELTFHPFNTFIGVPPYTVHLMHRGTRDTLPPRDVRLLSRFTPRSESLPVVPPPLLPTPSPGAQLLGATVVATFDLAGLDARGDYDVVVALEGKDASRSLVQMGLLR